MEIGPKKLSILVLGTALTVVQMGGTFMLSRLDAENRKLDALEIAANRAKAEQVVRTDTIAGVNKTLADDGINAKLELRAAPDVERPDYSGIVLGGLATSPIFPMATVAGIKNIKEENELADEPDDEMEEA